MSKQTLLELTQNILSAMSSDEVNSIGDTPESMQVATAIKTKYFDIINRSGTIETNQLIQLDASLDITQPTLMFIPNGVKAIEWIKYFNDDDHTDNSPGYTWVTILPTEQFIDYITRYNPSESDVGSFLFTDNSGRNYTFYYKNNTQPRFCTIFSNKYVIFDSYDATLDSTLQTSKTMCFGCVFPTFLMEDNFIPELGEDQFPLLLNEAKALSFYELKQMPHAKAEQEIKRQWASVQKNKEIDQGQSFFDQLPNYGRPTGRYQRVLYRK